MSAKQISRWVKQLEVQRAKVGKVRDELQECLEEMEHLKENCDRAYCDLVCAIDSLSELA